jgi:site-specific DNA-methyltransferase (adenine-specific)
MWPFFPITESVGLWSGDCLEAMAQMEENSVDAICCDPPYHFVSMVKRFGRTSADKENFAMNNPSKQFGALSRGFMGKEWDGGDIAFRVETWAAVARVLKPGGHLVAFGAPKNYHRLACAIEDAGFEIRDSLMWIFGMGFPKSHNIGDGWGTALKPAFEPIVLARKPLSENTIAANVLKWGTGALNIDACRIESELPEGRKRHGGGIVGAGSSYELPDSHGEMPSGRWPANVCYDGSDEVVAMFPYSTSRVATITSKPGAVYGNGAGLPSYTGTYGANDSGSAARFFYSAKANAKDRAGSKHPTVKPVSLMRWLVRMICPPGGVVLDPFAGSGTTGQACVEEGFAALLCEREAEYQRDIERRMQRLTSWEGL